MTKILTILASNSLKNLTIMKKTSIYSFLLTGLFSCSVFLSYAQQTEKELKSDIKQKAIKEARREAKRMGKDGWYVAPGSLPLDKLIENAWMKQYMHEEK